MKEAPCHRRGSRLPIELFDDFVEDVFLPDADDAHFAPRVFHGVTRVGRVDDGRKQGSVPAIRQFVNCGLTPALAPPAAGDDYGVRVDCAAIADGQRERIEEHATID